MAQECWLTWCRWVLKVQRNIRVMCQMPCDVAIAMLNSNHHHLTKHKIVRAVIIKMREKVPWSILSNPLIIMAVIRASGPINCPTKSSLILTGIHLGLTRVWTRKAMDLQCLLCLELLKIRFCNSYSYRIKFRLNRLLYRQNMDNKNHIWTLQLLRGKYSFSRLMIKNLRVIHHLNKEVSK